MKKLGSGRKLQSKTTELLPPGPAPPKKKTRTQRPRQIRSRFSPILLLPSSSATNSTTALPVDSSLRRTGMAGLDGELNLKKRKFVPEENLEPEPASGRIITRYYLKRRQGQRSTAEYDEVTEVRQSEIGSAVSVAKAGNSKLISESDVSIDERNPTSSRRESRKLMKEKEAHDKCGDESVVVDERPELGCLEQFSCDEVVSDETAFHSDVYLDSLSELDYTPSIFLDTGSQLSERSDSEWSPGSSATWHMRTSGEWIEEEEEEESSVISSALLFSSNLELTSLLLSCILLASFFLLFDSLIAFYS